jgi:hypothetical protein
MSKHRSSGNETNAIRDAAGTLSKAFRSLQHGRAGTLRVRRPANVRIAINVGSSGATRNANAVQTVPIIQSYRRDGHR